MGAIDSWMLMGEFAPDGRELALNYALTRHDALGVLAGGWRADVNDGESAPRREYAGATYTRLVHRWNLPHAQANVWFVGAAGALRRAERDGSQGFAWPALLADYETTRIYTSAGLKLLRSGGFKQDLAYLRGGFSFYEAEYEDPQPWFVLEAKRTRELVTKNEVTALLRVIHKRYFVELGASRDGGRFNFMYNY
jgi:hypothetical protein